MNGWYLRYKRNMKVPHTKQVHTNAYCIGYATWMYETCVTVDVVAVVQNGNKAH